MLNAIDDFFENPGYLVCNMAPPDFCATSDALQLDLPKVTETYIDLLKASYYCTKLTNLNAN